MRRLAWILVIGLAATACGSSRKDVIMAPGSRLIFDDGTHRLWSQCDRGNRIYMTPSGDVQVIPNGCPGGEP